MIKLLAQIFRIKMRATEGTSVVSDIADERRWSLRLFARLEVKGWGGVTLAGPSKSSTTYTGYRGT